MPGGRRGRGNLSIEKGASASVTKAQGELLSARQQRDRDYPSLRTRGLPPLPTRAPSPRPRTEAQGSSPVVPDPTRVTPDNALMMGGLVGAEQQPPSSPARGLAFREPQVRCIQPHLAAPSTRSSQKGALGRGPACGLETETSRTEPIQTHLRPARRPVTTRNRKRSQKPEVTAPGASMESRSVEKPSTDRIDRCPAAAPGISLRMRALAGWVEDVGRGVGKGGGRSLWEACG